MPRRGLGQDRWFFVRPGRLSGAVDPRRVRPQRNVVRQLVGVAGQPLRRAGRHLHVGQAQRAQFTRAQPGAELQRDRTAVAQALPAFGVDRGAVGVGLANEPALQLVGLWCRQMPRQRAGIGGVGQPHGGPIGEQRGHGGGLGRDWPTGVGAAGVALHPPHQTDQPPLVARRQRFAVA